MIAIVLQMEVLTEDYYKQVEEVSNTQEKLSKCEEQLTAAEVNLDTNPFTSSGFYQYPLDWSVSRRDVSD